MSELIFHTELDLFYRGERDYIYGPDLFDAAVQSVFDYFNISQISSVDFSSHDMTRFGLDFFLFKSAQDEVNYSFHSKLFFTYDGTKYFAYLVKNNEEVIKRIPYPEQEIVAISELSKEQKSVEINEVTPFKLTDNYTALTKYLHYQAFPEITGKWIFVRVLYPEYHSNMKYQTLKVVNRRIFGNKYTQNTLLLDDKKIGVLNFALI
jgi:hypothetical protein